MAQAPAESLRERKRRETLRRITDAGICLFVEKGFEGATIDEIAAAAGISRRTFFHYFESKDDILLSLQSNMGERIADAVRHAPPDAQPLAALRDAMLEACASIPPDDMVAIDRLMRGSASVQARKQASYVQHEETIFSALRERWPAPDRAMGLRLVALLAVGAVRLATEIFGREVGARPLPDVLSQAFSAVEGEIARDRPRL